jgi:hypothetical protein
MPKKNTMVILLSSQCHNKSCMDESQAFKPEIISNYSATQGGVEVADKMARQYAQEHVSVLSDCSAICLM